MKRIVAVTALLLVAGCASSPKTQFYVLNPVAAEPRAATFDGSPIVVGDVRIPDYLDRPEMVRRVGENQIDVSTVDHWGGPLGSMIRDTLRRDLESRLPSASIDLSNHPGRQAPYRVLTVSIQDFVSGPSNAVTLAADWTVQPHGSSSPTLCGHDRINVAIPTKMAAAEADGMSRALGMLADHIAAALVPGGTSDRRCRSGA